MNSQPGTFETDRKSTFAPFSLLAGVLSVLLLLASFLSTPGTPAEQLALVTSNRISVILFASIVLAWAVFSIPFVVTLGTVLRPRGEMLAQAATILSAVGMVLLGFGMFMHVGALLAVVDAGSPPSPAEATYQVAIWTSLGYYLTDPGLMTWGLGQLLFGWLAWKSDVLPNWLAVLGMVGGIAGLLTLTVFQTSILALVQIVSFAVWGIATGILLRRGHHQ